MRKRWLFDDDRMGFRFEDDAFRFTAAPDYARGAFKKPAGAASGLLEMTLGGRDDDVVRGMSGGWTKSFSLEEDEIVTLTFRFKLTQSGDYRSNEFTDLRLTVDGEKFKVDGESFLARIDGDGEGGPAISTGWRTMEVQLGRLEAGRHDFTLGAFNNKKNAQSSFSTLSIDKIELDGEPAPEVRLAAPEKEVLRLTNAFRAKHGLDPVRAEANLMAAAEDWSRDMAKGDFYRHSQLPDQFEDFGYSARGYGENIAAGYPTPKAVVDGWINSPGHRANLLREDFEHIGIGYYNQSNDGGDVRYGRYWTQIFGDPSNDYLG